MRETVWLLSKRVSEKLSGADIGVVCPFMRMENVKGLSLEWDDNCFSGCFIDELDAEEQLLGYGCEKLGEL